MFLENENSLIGINVYNRRGTNAADTPIPSLLPGNFNVGISTKPGSRYFRATLDSVITIK